MGPAQVERADRWFRRYGEPLVLFGRVVPLLRAFVSLPAGVARMPIGRFSVLTFVGSIPWVLGLALAGHALGGEWKSVRRGFEYVDYALLAMIAAGIVYLLVRRRRARRAPSAGAAASTARAEASSAGADASTARAEASAAGTDASTADVS